MARYRQVLNHLREKNEIKLIREWLLIGAQIPAGGPDAKTCHVIEVFAADVGSGAVITP